jgi:predicted nuclease of predicted toxin-antitoxin system
MRELSPRLPDEQILELAVQTDRLVVTNDKGFGTMAFRDRAAHCGIILLRLPDARAKTKLAAMERVFAHLPDELSSAIVVVTERAIRVTRGDTVQDFGGAE